MEDPKSAAHATLQTLGFTKELRKRLDITVMPDLERSKATRNDEKLCSRSATGPTPGLPSRVKL